jgi:hypothetical protein
MADGLLHDAEREGMSSLPQYQPLLETLLTSRPEPQDCWITLPVGTRLLDILRPRRIRHVAHIHNHNLPDQGQSAGLDLYTSFCIHA